MTIDGSPAQLACAEVKILRMTNGRVINYNYLVFDPLTREAVVIDPAWQMDVLTSAVAAQQLILKGVLLTHSHYDHIHLAIQVAEWYQCPMWMHSAEIAFSQFQHPQLVAIEEQPWQMGRFTIQPVLTAGHTPGSCCYLIENDLFTGDTLFNEGCGFCANPQDAAVLYQSLQKLKSLCRSDTRIFPGHVYYAPVGQLFSAVMQSNVYLHFATAKQFTDFLLRKRSHMVTMR